MLINSIIQTNGEGEIVHVEFVEGRMSDEFEVCDVISSDPKKSLTTRIYEGNANGGDSIEITDQFDHGTLFADNL